MSENQPPYGGAPGGQPGPYGQNPYDQNPYEQVAQPYGQVPAYPGGGQQDVNAYGQVPTGMPPLAHWGWRVLSALIDGLVVGIPQVAVTYGVNRPAGSLVALIGLVVLAYVEGTKGQTPGKMAVGTHTLREADGQVLGFWRALGRRLAHLIDTLACFVGYLWPLWDDKRQTFADKIASSVVIKP
ncbi:RDD family protein [Streptomyces sp. NPDC020917]|uniref:RDD family protein n=1 Tax=Streptomyces sp. NPDC020917 TaxID=3365102 RepID=UPI003798FF0A